MTTLSTRKNSSSSIVSSVCLIVGLACLAGFAVDFFILAVPPRIGSVQWRVSILQQLADRSIILLFGMALVFCGSMASRSWKQLIAYTCLSLGVIYIISCVSVLRDSGKLQQQTLTNIENQATELRSQIDQALASPSLVPDLTPERIQQASDQLTSQTAQLKENSKQTILKAAISSIGNLLVVGISFLGLGLYASRVARL